MNLENKIVTQVFRYIASTILLWILTGTRFFNFWKEKKLVSTQLTHEGLIWIWFFLSFIPVSVGKRFEDHYFLFLTPSLSILAAVAIDRWPELSWKRWKPWVLIGIILPTLGFTITRYYLHPLNAKLDGEEMNAYKPYAAYLHEKTKPNDFVFVWGCGPSIYLLADRRPASRFHRTDVLAGRVSGIAPGSDKPFNPQEYVVPETWEMFFEDVQHHPPAYIMDLAPTGLHDFSLYPMTNYPQLMEFVSKYYIREIDFQKAVVYRRKG